MRIVDGIKLSIAGLRGGLLRTMLTILSLAIGVAAVLAVLALSEAGERRVEDEIAHLGVNKVWIRAASDGTALKVEDAWNVSQAVQAPACAGAYTMTNAVHDGQSALVQIAGFDASASAVHAFEILEGRLLVSLDFDGEANVCLIDEVLNDYFGGDMLGAYIRLSNCRVRVVGIMKPMSLQTLSGGHGMLVMPLGEVVEALGGSVAEITVAVRAEQDIQQIANKAADTLGVNEVRADTLEKEISAAKEIVRIFVMVLLCIAIVCMLSGGVGVMNVLTIAVRERRTEIGLIKAIGGTAGQIILLFLLEAVAYAVLGSVIGILVGQGMIMVCGRWIGLTASMRLETVVPVLIAATSIGVCSGVLPAVQAASLRPIDALRRE